MPIPLLRYGFRPFFLAVGLSGILLLPWWASSFAWGIPLGTAWPPTLWHSHEMLFGFIGAAVAGFLLTAVPSWTGERGFAGLPPALLASLWLLGRVLVSTSRLWPMPIVATVDLAFLPVLAGMLAQPLLRARNRNTPMLLVLGALWLCDLDFYRGLIAINDAQAQHALLIGIDVMLLLVTVVGGRIVPAFTASALKQSGRETSIRAWRGMTPACVALMVAVAVTDLEWANSRIAGFVGLTVPSKSHA